MEKTLTINISGWVFNINEDAYNLLTEYFQKLKEYFSKQEGGEEIVADIEARVAELFKEKFDEKETVITLDHVNTIMNIMGQPYEMEEDMEEEQEEPRKPFNIKMPKKKLYRDTMNGHVAGVAAGLGKYINLDPIFVRIAFLLLIPTGGLGILLYIILWILIPEATSTSDRIRMEGKKVNVENIESKVREEADYIKDRLNDFSEEARDVYHRTGPVRQKSLKRIEKIFQSFGRILKRIFLFIIGLVLFSTGATFLVGFVLLYFNFVPSLHFDTFFVNGLSFPNFLGTFILDTSFTSITLVALTIVAIIPIIMLVFNGIRFIFNLKRNKVVGTIAFQAWVVALIISIGMSYTTLRSFKSEAVNITAHSLDEIQSDTIHIILNTNSYYEDILSADNLTVISQDDNYPILHDGDFYGEPKLRIHISDKDVFELKEYTYANGYDEQQALENIEKVSYHFTKDSLNITLDPYYKLQENSQWRSQDIKLELQIPEGKVVALDRNIRKHFSLRYQWRNRLNKDKGETSYWIAKGEKFVSLNKKPAKEVEIEIKSDESEVIVDSTVIIAQ